MSYGNYNMMNMMNMFNMSGMSGMFGSYNNPFASIFGSFMNPFMGMFGGSSMCSNSIFGNYGYSSACDEAVFNRALGWNLGTTFVGIAAMAIGAGVRNHQSKGDMLSDLLAEKEQIIKDAGAGEDEIINFAANECAEAKTLNSAKALTSSKQAVVDGLKSDYESAKVFLAKYAGYTDNQKEECKTQYDKAVETKLSYEKAEKELNDAKVAQDTAQKAYDAKVKAMTEAKTKLTSLNEKIGKLQEEINKKTYKKADGTPLGRVKKETLDSAQKDEQGNYTGIDEAYIKSALHEYHTAATSEMKEHYKDVFIAMYESYYNNNDQKPTKSLQESYDLIKG